MPGIQHLITVVPYSVFEEMKERIKNDPGLRDMDRKGVAIGRTSSGKMILNADHRLVKEFILSKSLDAKEPGVRRITERKTDPKAKEHVDEPEKASEKKPDQDVSEGIFLTGAGGKWEKCDVSKNAELKKKLKDCPKEKRKHISKREKSVQRSRSSDGRDI